MSLNSKTRAVCQFMTVHALRMPRHELIFRLHCFSKHPSHRFLNKLCTITLPSHDGLDEGGDEGAPPPLLLLPPPFAPPVCSLPLTPKCSTMNLRARSSPQDKKNHKKYTHIKTKKQERACVKCMYVLRACVCVCVGAVICHRRVVRRVAS